MPLVVAIFAGPLAYRWATDLDTGWLELVLGTPRRWLAVTRIVLSILALVSFVVLIVAGVNGDSGSVRADLSFHVAFL